MALRYFREDGGEWTVWDTHPSAGDGATSRIAVNAAMLGGWLTFERGSEKRRLFPIPEGWAELPEAELAALLPRTVDAGRSGSAAGRAGG